MTKFEALKAITDERKFSELVFDIIGEYDSPIKFAKLLSEEFSEDGLRTIESLAQSPYPLSFERRQ